MDFRKICLAYLVISLAWMSAQAQSDIAIGSWKSYLPYNEGLLVTESPEKIIYATEWSIVTIDKDDFSLSYLTKVEGLNDISISAIAYNEFSDQLVISYENSNIDVVQGDEIFNVPNIKTNTSILGNKRINDIYINSNNAYLSCGFGVVEYDLQAQEFGFTSFTDLEVFETTILNQYIYAATEDGVYFFDLSSNFNPADFGLWQLLDAQNGLPPLYESKSVASKNGQIYIATETALYVSNNGMDFTKLLDADEDFKTSFITEFVDHIGWAINNNPSFKSQFLHIAPDGSVFENTDICAVRLTGALKDSNGRYWFADSRAQIKYTEDINASCQKITIDGPKNHEASDIDIDDGIVYVASGGVSESFGYQFTSHGFYILEDNQWNNVNRDTDSSLGDNEYFNIYQVAKDPMRDLLWVGSYFSGLMSYNLTDGSKTYYDTQNSSLGEVVGDAPRIRISGLRFDEQGNLWISNFGAQRPLSVYTHDEQWKNFSSPSDTKLAQIAIDEQGYKWITVGGNSGGVVVFDSGVDPIDTGDDQNMRFINLNNSEITSGIVNCVDVDLDGDVWVGTEAGPVVFECGTTAVENACRGNRRIFVQDSIPDILLKTEDIRSIEVDGANRKWFGTKNGVYILSPDTETQIAHFTSENSPLFDNTIRDLEYNPESGEMFIATNKGVIAYRSPTTEGKQFHQASIVAFPNPVRPDYQGVIAIKGLAQDAEIKITDINGRLVYETDALGGQAIWDGTDYNGRRASTGVYLVFSSSSDSFLDPDSAVAKIMFVH